MRTRKRNLRPEPRRPQRPKVKRLPWRDRIWASTYPVDLDNLAYWLGSAGVALTQIGVKEALLVEMAEADAREAVAALYERLGDLLAELETPAP